MKPKGDIDSAIAEIERQMANGEPINLSKTAGKFSVERSTLSRRIAGVSRSWEEYLSQQVQHLTNAQEKALIKRINYLSDKRMPPTCQIVKNLAEEICRHPVDKNYVNRFVHRHSNVLKSRYLRCIPIERVKAEYIPNFLYFFQLVYTLFSFIFIYGKPNRVCRDRLICNLATSCHYRFSPSLFNDIQYG